MKCGQISPMGEMICFKQGGFHCVLSGPTMFCDALANDRAPFVSDGLLVDMVDRDKHW